MPINQYFAVCYIIVIMWHIFTRIFVARSKSCKHLYELGTPQDFAKLLRVPLSSFVLLLSFVVLAFDLLLIPLYCLEIIRVYCRTISDAIKAYFYSLRRDYRKITNKDIIFICYGRFYGVSVVVSWI